MTSASHPAVKDYDIRIVKPCVDDPNYFTAHASLGSGLDMDAICDKLEEEGNTRISRSLGVAKFNIENSEITLYRNGRVDLRKIRDEEHALEIVGQVMERFGEYIKAAT